MSFQYVLIGRCKETHLTLQSVVIRVFQKDVSLELLFSMVTLWAMKTLVKFSSWGTFVRFYAVCLMLSVIIITFDRYTTILTNMF